jgi:Ni/Fe-hydrogenase 1 B-type cytochrome subunit
MFVAVSVLLFTGLYMNTPWEMIQLPLRTVRKIHTLFSFILITNLAGQIYYYLYTTKFTEILFFPRNWANVPSFIRYVLFITNSHPNYGRYNPGQKLLFSLWFLSVLLAAVTGMVLLFPDPANWLQRILGGLNVIRILHFGVAIFFAMSIPLHLYLVFTESPANLQAMFTGYINKEIIPEILTEEKKDPGI